MSIRSDLFPKPDITYSGENQFSHALAVSIIALGIDIICHGGNELKDKPWQFFYRDYMVPRPRPSTILAWDRICRLGKPDSKAFILPYLPSITEDDQMYGVQNGMGLHSLHRKSKIHVKVDDRIEWGCVYLGILNDKPTESNILAKTIETSSLVEAQVLGYKGTRQFIDGDSSQYSIRDRMEWLAAMGIPALDWLFDENHFPRIDRVMFQFLSQKAAANWALTYNEMKNLMDNVPDQNAIVKEDYRVMTKTYLENLKEKKIKELTGDKEKNTIVERRFGKNTPDL